MGIALAAIAATSWAQPPRGGAGIVDNVKPPPQKPSAPAPAVAVPADERPALQTKSTVKIDLRAVRFSGNTVYSNPTLRSLVQDFLGRTLGVSDLEELTARITRHYRAHGYAVARAYLPVQDVKRGEIEVAIVEGRYDTVEIERKARFAMTAMTNPVSEGDLVHAPTLERTLLLLNDLAGIRASAVLRPGPRIGTTDAKLSLEKEASIAGTFDIDNFGSRYSGRVRGGLGLDLNNPLALGDQLSVRGLGSDGEMDYGYAGYTVPVALDGLKLRLNHSKLRYGLGEELAPLEITGTAEISGAGLVYPLVRSRLFNLYGGVAIEHKIIEEFILGMRTSRDELRVGSFSLAGDRRSAQGLTSFGANMAQGVGGFYGAMAGDNDPDASRPNTGGTFTKLALDTTHRQRLSPSYGVGARVAGQAASTAVVGAEQFTVGGPAGVRAYPQGEALGDRGYVASFELYWNPRGAHHGDLGNRQWGDLARWSAFFDIGEAVVRDPLPGQDRTRQLRGAGVGLQLGLSTRFMVNASHAWPIDGNADATSETRSKGQFWFQAVTWF